MVTKDNFHLNSETTFIRVFHKPATPPDFISMKNRIVSNKGSVIEVDTETKQVLVESETEWCKTEVLKYTATFINKEGDTCYVCPTTEISSQYWFTETGVFRESDHWGKCRFCMWNIDLPSEEREMVIGYSSWEYFREIDPKTYEYSQKFTWAQAGKMV